MRTIRIIRNWTTPNLFRQTPEQDGIWEDFRFTTDPIEACDYLLILNHNGADQVVTVAKQNIWCLTQEPPVPEYMWLRQGFKDCFRVFSQDISAERVTASYPATPWWVGKSYRELKQMPMPEKNSTLSWVMSSKKASKGHEARLNFLNTVQNTKPTLAFDLWGRGFQEFADKWDVIAPYQYSVAIENYSTPHYWTEKLTDVLLGWSLPFYHGAPNITEYLPAEAIISIDIYDPKTATEIMYEAILTQQWQKRLDAIIHARELILDKLQFFPHVVGLIREFEKEYPPHLAKARRVFLPATSYQPLSLQQRLKQQLKKVIYSW
jgi:hypothetical protein